MTNAEVQDYLYKQIPLSAAMEVKVDRMDSTGIELSAPLEPNINHRQTAFGGSLSAVATLAAWTLLHMRLQHESSPAQLVIQYGQMDYIAPARGSFVAKCANLEPKEWDRFLNGLTRKGRARIRLQVEVTSGILQVAKFEGEFVALTQC
ncbi:MAG: thioesterase domain-containing protein [Armatimonadetes bacterium]|nr:thioesterase domain-containing protein [Armatimonadota bacterium]